jgi:hypothetical protein
VIDVCRFLRHGRGAAIIEYAIIAFGIAVPSPRRHEPRLSVNGLYLSVANGFQTMLLRFV